MRSVYFDVDDTLLCWTQPDKNFDNCGHGGYKVVLIKNVMFYAHQPHIDKLKQHALIGDEITLWSHGGELWTRVVADALGISKYISKYATKPDFYYDDTDYGKLGKRLYLNLKGEVVTNKDYQDNLKELLK